MFSTGSNIPIKIGKKWFDILLDVFDQINIENIQILPLNWLLVEPFRPAPPKHPNPIKIEKFIDIPRWTTWHKIYENLVSPTASHPEHVSFFTCTCHTIAAWLPHSTCTQRVWQRSGDLPPVPFFWPVWSYPHPSSCAYIWGSSCWSRIRHVPSSVLWVVHANVVGFSKLQCPPCGWPQFWNINMPPWVFRNCLGCSSDHFPKK